MAKEQRRQKESANGIELGEGENKLHSMYGSQCALFNATSSIVHGNLPQRSICWSSHTHIAHPESHL